MLPVVVENETRTPPLTFAVREGGVLPVVAESETRNPPTRICSEREGGVQPVVTENVVIVVVALLSLLPHCRCCLVLVCSCVVAGLLLLLWSFFTFFI